MFTRLMDLAFALLGALVLLGWGWPANPQDRLLGYGLAALVLWCLIDGLGLRPRRRT